MFLNLNKSSYSIRSYCEGGNALWLFGHTINILRDFSYIASKHLPKRTG